MKKFLHSIWIPRERSNFSVQTSKTCIITTVFRVKVVTRRDGVCGVSITQWIVFPIIVSQNPFVCIK